MAYNDFTLEMLIEQFHLTLQEDPLFFASFPPVAISDLLRQELEDNIPVALDIGTEKGRSELLVMPALMEVRRQFQRRISLFSGVEFNVAPEQGLRGVCDFLISLSPVRLTIQAPVVAIVEAKNDNIKSGIAQCIAEMLAAQRFNQRKDRSISMIHGGVTTGMSWRFFSLQEATVLVDDTEYSLRNPESVIGMLVGMVARATDSRAVEPD